MNHCTPVLLASALALAVAGCATKEYVNDQVGMVDQKVGRRQPRLDQYDAHLGQLDQTSREALDRATAPGKLAEGKLLYAVVLSDNSVKFPADGQAFRPKHRRC